MTQSDPEIAEYVSELESELSTAELPEATGDAIARDFERYLRRRGTNPGREERSMSDPAATIAP